MKRETLSQWTALMRAGAGTEGWSSPEPPASATEIRRAEASLGRRLPSSLTAMLKQSRAWSWRESGFDAVIFLPPDEIASESTEPADAGIDVAVALSETVKPYYYSDKRVTFATSDYYRFQIDEDPGEGGTSGQIVVVDFEEETIDVIADSLDAFVRRGIERLREQLAGGYPKRSGLRRKQARRPTVKAARKRSSTADAPTRDSRTLSEALVRYRDWLSSNAPLLFKQLRKGATDREIREAMAEYEFALPAEYFELFELFNGQRSMKACLLPCPLHRWNGLRLADVECMGSWRNSQIGSQWLYDNIKIARTVQANRGVADSFWCDGWLPFADSETVYPRERKAAHGLLYLDFDPANGGVPGQVVYQTVEREVRSGPPWGPELVVRTTVAASLRAYFDGVVMALENGRAGYQSDTGITWL